MKATFLHRNDTIFNDFFPFQQPDSVSATVDAGPASVYFDDAKKIADLFAGKAMEPPYDKLNWDAKRVFGTSTRRSSPSSARKAPPMRLPAP